MSTPPDVALLLRWCDITLERLGEAREEIDALNVYPVPDGDTGTNLYLTFEAARAAVVDGGPDSLAAALTMIGRGALLGARGNSGVILSQLMRAGADQLMRGDPRKPGQLLADTMTLAADAAYAAVAQPVEGTMLTVARAAAEAAQASVAHAPDDLAAQMGHVVRAGAAAASTALALTPEQLPVLAAAGVVDAGGRGLAVIFDAAVEALTGTRPPLRRRYRPASLPTPTLPTGDLSADGPAYEVMYLLEADDAAVRTLRASLAGLGDSLVVVGGDGLWNVHVHVDDVGAAVEAGIEVGRPYRVRVTHFAEQVAQSSGARRRRDSGLGVVVVAAGDGLAELFAAGGAVVVPGAPSRRSSTSEILAAIHDTGREQVIVLPNDGDTIAVAEAAAAAARDEGIRTAVIPTRAQVQGLAAVAVHDPARSFDEEVVAMSAAAGHTRQGAVTVAARDAMTMAGPCQVGDGLGVVEGDFVLVGQSLVEVAHGVVDRLLGGGGEMLTVVRGAEATDDLVDAVESYVRQRRPEIEIVLYDGGQSRYPLLLGVE